MSPAVNTYVYSRLTSPSGPSFLQNVALSSFIPASHSSKPRVRFFSFDAREIEIVDRVSLNLTRITHVGWNSRYLKALYLKVRTDFNAIKRKAQDIYIWTAT